MKVRISDHFDYKKLIRYVLPSIIMLVVTSVYTVIDGFFVSNFVGKTPFAAINLIMPFIMILGGFGFMIGTGGTAFVSMLIGKGKREEANRCFTALIIFAVLCGIVLSAVGIACMRPIARLLGAGKATDEMIDCCVLYGRIVVGFTPFFMLQYIFQSFLAGAEKPKLGLMVTVIAGVANAVLDALFIAVLDWGVAGAAAATGIGQFLGGGIPLIYFAKKNGSLLRFVKTKLRFKIIIKVCGNGISELLTNVAASVVTMLYNFRLLAYLGENGVSAYGVLMYVQFIFNAIIIGYSVGSAPIIGYNYGAQNDDELKNIFKKSMWILAVSGVILSGLAQALAVPLGKLFVGYDAELYTLTVHAFRLYSFAYVFSGVAIFSSGFFTALNNGLISAVLSVLRTLVFQVAFVFILPLAFGVDGIWWAMLATEICATVVSVVLFIAYRKKYRYA